MLQGATAFYDQNQDGHYEANEEKSTKTDTHGYYALEDISEPQSLTLTGGHHKIFGETFQGTLSTPKYATQMTQATTVLNFMIEELTKTSPKPVHEKANYVSFVRQAEQIFNRAFGIEENIEITTVKPEKDTQLFAINAALHSIMNDVAIAYETAYGEDSERLEIIYYQTAKSIAKHLLAKQETPDAYLDFERVIASEAVKTVMKDVGTQIMVGDKPDHSYDDVAYIVAPDIAIVFKKMFLALDFKMALNLCLFRNTIPRSLS